MPFFCGWSQRFYTLKVFGGQGISADKGGFCKGWLEFCAKASEFFKHHDRQTASVHPPATTRLSHGCIAAHLLYGLNIPTDFKSFRQVRVQVAPAWAHTGPTDTAAAVEMSKNSFLQQHKGKWPNTPFYSSRRGACCPNLGTGSHERGAPLKAAEAQSSNYSGSIVQPQPVSQDSDWESVRVTSPEPRQAAVRPNRPRAERPRADSEIPSHEPGARQAAAATA